MEVWRDVVGYEDLYEVSNMGRVRSKPRRLLVHRGRDTYWIDVGGKVVSGQERRHGYLSVCLYGRPSRNGRFTQKSIHRLVAEAFLQNPNNYTEVNHKDENKKNNCVDNLEWCNHCYNSNFGTRNARLGATNTNNPKTSKAVAQYTMDGELVAVYPSLGEVKRHGYWHGNVLKCIQGRAGYSHAHGYIWRYANE